MVLLKKYPNSQAVQEVMLRQVMQPSGQGVQVLFSTNMFLVQFKHTNWLPVTMQDTQKFTDNEHWMQVPFCKYESILQSVQLVGDP